MHLLKGISLIFGSLYAQRGCIGPQACGRLPAIREILFTLCNTSFPHRPIPG